MLLPYDPRDENKISETLLQDIPNHILENHLSTFWNVDGGQVTIVYF